MTRFVFVLVLAAAAVASRVAAAQTAKDVVGTWTFVSYVAERGGKKVELFGSDGKGRMVLGADGRYLIVIVRAGLPKFASGSRLAGSPEENKAIVQGSNAHFGTYTVDEAATTLIFHIEGATFPNWDGAEQKRPLTLTGDELKYTVPTSTTGSGPAEVIWRRLN
jgi:polyisoprenoid-binding protein YceI